MDLNDSQILIGIAVLMLLVGAGSGVWWWLHRRAEAAAADRARLAAHVEWIHRASTPALTIDPDAGTTGRHHPPDALLGGVTYRLSPDGRARAKVATRTPTAPVPDQRSGS